MNPKVTQYLAIKCQINDVKTLLSRGIDKSDLDRKSFQYHLYLYLESFAIYYPIVQNPFTGSRKLQETAQAIFEFPQKLYSLYQERTSSVHTGGHVAGTKEGPYERCSDSFFFFR